MLRRKSSKQVVQQTDGRNNPSNSISDASSSIARPSMRGGNGSSNTASSSTRRRGPTRGVGNFGQKVGQKMLVDWNAHCQPIGKNSSHFTHFLGYVVRHSGHAPLQFKSWTEVPEHAKDSLWREVQRFVEIDDDKRDWVMLSMSMKYKGWKNDLKQNYLQFDTDEERLLNIPSNVSEADWTWLVHYWSTPEAQVVSKRNSENRKNQVIKHVGGTKSCAQYRHELGEGREPGNLPTRAEVFRKTHIKKNGSPSDPKSAELMAKMQMDHEKSGGSDSTPIGEKIFTDAFGPDGHGRVRTYGLGPTPKSVFGSSSRSSRTSYAEMQSQLTNLQQTLEENKREHEEKFVEMQNQMQSQIQSQVQEQIAQYFRTMFPDGHPPSQGL